MRWLVLLACACRSDDAPEAPVEPPVRHAHEIREPIDRAPPAPPIERGFATACGEPKRGDEHPSAVARWVGTAYQFDIGESWTIDVTIDLGDVAIGAKAGDVRYPSLGCAGELYRAADIGGRRVVLERIRSDPKHTCYDGGTLRFACKGGALEYRSYYANGPQNSSATLKRAP